MVTVPPIQMANVGVADTFLLMVMALVVFGPRRLPQIGRQIGKLMYEFRKASNDFKYQMEEELRNAEEADRRQKEEERQRQLALAAPAQPAETIAAVTTEPVLETGDSGAASTESILETSDSGAVGSPFHDEAQYEALPEPESQVGAPDSPAEEPHLRIQPPSTGEQVPAAPPGALKATPESAEESAEVTEPATHHG